MGLYHAAGAPLAPRPLPPDLRAAEYGTFVVALLAFAAEMTLPDLSEQEVGIAEGELREDPCAAYWEVQHRHGDGTRRVLGNPDPVQDVMRGQCALVSRGINTGSHQLRQATRQALGVSEAEVAGWARAAPDEWELLLQLDSYEDEAGMLWGDLGRCYFWLPRAALARRDFGAVWQRLQCF